MNPPGEGLHRWERAAIRAALLTWPATARDEDGESVLETYAARQLHVHGSTTDPPPFHGLARALDTMLEAADIARTGLRLRAARRRERPRRGGWEMGGGMSVVREGLRGVVRSARWSLLVTAVLAAGLGSTLAVFTVVDAVALRPLPYPAADELLRIGSVRDGRPGLSASSGPNFRDLEASSRTLASVAASVGGLIGIQLDDRPPETVRGGWVSGRMFETLGRPAAQGRTLVPADEDPTEPLVVVLSHALWQSHFGGQPAVGRTIAIEETPATVVGVMPPDFHPPEASHLGDTRLWAPLAKAPMPVGERGLSFADIVGRRSSDATAEQVEAELVAIGRGIAEANGLDPRGFDGFAALPLLEETLGDAGTTLRLLLGAVALLLAIACVNVGSMVLLRTIDRAEALKIRLSLGASRARVVATVVVETLTIALVAGVVGLVGAWAAVEAVVRTAPVDLPRLVEVQIDVRVAAVALALSAAVGLVVGLVPTLHVVRSTELGTGRGSRNGVRSPALERARDALVLVQVSLGLALAIGAGLLTQSLVRLHAVEPGFDPAGLYVATFRMRGIGGPDFEPELLDRLVASTTRLPGVTSASLSSGSPYTPGGRVGYVEPEGVELSQDHLAGARIEFHRSGPGHVTALGIDVIEGRDIASTDRADSEPVVVVSESLAREYWPDGDALGARLVVGGDGTFALRTVVGIVRSPRYRGPGLEDEQHLWLPYTQMPLQPLDLVIRADPATPVAAELAQMLDGFDDRITMRTFRSPAMEMGRYYAQPTFFAALLTTFAAVALLLAAVGLYSTLGHRVRSRRSELGVRLALGARSGDLTRAVVARGLAVTALGVGVGLALSNAGAHVLEAFLFRTESSSPTVWLGASALMIGVGVVASWLPARTAGRTSPALSLRAE